MWRADGSDSRTARIDSAASIHSLTAVGDNLFYVASNASGSESLGIVSDAGFFPLSVHHTELTSIANLAVAGGCRQWILDNFSRERIGARYEE